MRSLRPSLLKVLLLVIVASLMSSVIASAAPIAGDDYGRCGGYGKVQPGVDGGGCCQQKEAKLASASVEGRGGCCQQPSKLASTAVESRGGCCHYDPKVASSFAGRSGSYNCCQQDNKIASSFAGRGGYGSQCCDQQPLKIASQVNGGKGWEKPPCETTPALAPTCGLDMPVGSVVGDLPVNTQADYAAGLIATDVTINAGTYWVTGIAKAANGDPFYRIIVACQYLYVPVGSMQPSFQAPWNGEALPTNEVP